MLTKESTVSEDWLLACHYRELLTALSRLPSGNSMAMSEAQNGLQRELGRHLDKGQLSRSLKMLTARGLVDAADDQQDARKKRFRITERGRVILGALAEGESGLQRLEAQRGLAEADPKEIEFLVRILTSPVSPEAEESAQHELDLLARSTKLWRQKRAIDFLTGRLAKKEAKASGEQAEKKEPEAKAEKAEKKEAKERKPKEDKG